MASKKVRDIEVETTVGSETTVFLVANTALGEEILNRISTGEYFVSRASGPTAKPGAVTVVLERKKGTKEETREDDESKPSNS